LVAKSAARASHGLASKSQEDARLDEVLPLIKSTEDQGITLSEIREKNHAPLKAVKGRLAALVKEGAVREIKHGAPKKEYYFAAGYGPSVESVSLKVVRVVWQAESTPASESLLQKELAGIDSVFLKDAIKHAIETEAIRGPFAKEKYYFPADRGPTVESVSEKVVRLVQKGGGAMPVSEKLLQGQVPEVEVAFFPDAIKRAIDTKAIRGPYAKEKYYFIADSGPTVESVREKVVSLIRNAGYSAPSIKFLKGQVECCDGIFLAEAIEDAVKSRVVMELICDKNKYYVHRDAAAGHFGEFLRGDRSRDKALVFEDVLPAYERIKRQQRGLAAVNISELLEALHVSKQVLHDLLLKEMKTGRVTIHPSTVPPPEPVMEAGIELPGRPYRYVTVVIKGGS
jgi:hypothetical protein